jgi:uncharacterized membrane protein YphA (DoxX/SURF4 family)
MTVLSRLVSALARACLGWLFINRGIAVLRRPAGPALLASATLSRIRAVVPGLPASDVLMVRANAAIQVLGGLTLARGRHPRLAATALAGSLIPTTVAGHPYWQVTDPAQRAGDQVQLEKNVAILGGLLLAAAARRA